MYTKITTEGEKKMTTPHRHTPNPPVKPLKSAKPRFRVNINALQAANFILDTYGDPDDSFPLNSILTHVKSGTPYLFDGVYLVYSTQLATYFLTNRIK